MKKLKLYNIIWLIVGMLENHIKKPLTIFKQVCSYVKPQDIMTFFQDNDKSNNDATNKIRENIISNILNIPSDYLNHSEFGPQWNNVQNKLSNTLISLCNVSYNHISIEPKGGMKYNHDFEVHYNDNDNKPVHIVNLEFKHNNSNVKELVQFLELYDKDCKTKFNLFEYSYSEYYYDHFLDRYLEIEIDENKTIIKPSKEVYLKHVHDIKYKHPFFNHIYTNKLNNKKRKELLVEESRKEFIKTYAHLFNFEKITEKIIDSQNNKVFLLWDKNNFHIQMIDVTNIRISGIKPGSINNLYFDVVVDNFIYNIRIRLNWGNNNGIANPRWKFSFIDK